MPETIFDPELVRRTLKERGITVEQFARAVGLPHRSAVNKIFRGERRVQMEEAAKIYSYLGLVSVEHDAVRTVPVIGLTAAGNWREAVEMPIGKMMVPAKEAGARSFAVEVKGDSMDLLIEDGGWIVVDPDDKVLSPGKSYLLQNHDHEVTVKRYQKSPARFEPVSSNPDNVGFLVSDFDPIILGRVVWKGSRV
jgi:SOS-response transcriptional repressor LexA